MANTARTFQARLANSSFVWHNYQTNGSKEPETHKRARLRVGSLISQAGHAPDYKKAIKITEEWTVYPDIYFEAATPTVCEFLGDSHNTTTRKYDKDQSRKRALEEKGNRVIELQVNDVNGWILPSTKRYFRLTDAEIYAMTI